MKAYTFAVETYKEGKPGREWACVVKGKCEEHARRRFFNEMRKLDVWVRKCRLQTQQA